MLCVGRAIAVAQCQKSNLKNNEPDSHRALNDVSIALFASRFPLPSLSFAFWKVRGQRASYQFLVYICITEKSAALSFLFFALFGIILSENFEKVVFQHISFSVHAVQHVLLALKHHSW
jgi:hypothetical protein